LHIRLRVLGSPRHEPGHNRRRWSRRLGQHRADARFITEQPAQQMDPRCGVRPPERRVALIERLGRGRRQLELRQFARGLADAPVFTLFALDGSATPAFRQ